MNRSKSARDRPTQPSSFVRPPPPQPPRLGECRAAGPERPTARNGQGARRAGRRGPGAARCGPCPRNPEVGGAQDSEPEEREGGLGEADQQL
eukprot:2291040-Alexandrium_andersonii.AAC.1